MRSWKFTNSGWMRKLEAVKRLIVISNNAQVCAQKIDNPLFGFVEVLIFVHEHIVVQAALRCGRIVFEIPIHERNDLAYQHSAMKGEPTYKRNLKGRIG